VEGEPISDLEKLGGALDWYVKLIEIVSGRRVEPWSTEHGSA